MNTENLNYICDNLWSRYQLRQKDGNLKQATKILKQYCRFSKLKEDIEWDNIINELKNLLPNKINNER